MTNFVPHGGNPIPEPVQQALSKVAGGAWKASGWLGAAAAIIATLATASATLAVGFSRVTSSTTPALPA